MGSPRSASASNTGWPRSAWVAVLAVALGGAVLGALIGDYVDLSVYRYGGRSVLDAVAPYAAADPATGYPFTYPPFAAVGFVPLALVPGTVASALWLALSAGCLAGALVIALRGLGLRTSGWRVAAITVGALALEPVWQNFTFGQINTLVMVVVLAEVVRPERRSGGVMLGIVAGVKLTPLVFVPLLVLVGQGRAAGRAVVTFAATVAVGFLVMPGSATSYWTERLLDPARVGPPELAHNQSVAGMFARMLGEPSTGLWLVVAGPLALGTILVAAAWWRRGDRVSATFLGALAMLLASPISWSHHWVWAVLGVVVLWHHHRLAAAAWAAVFVARPILWPHWGGGRELDWRWYDHLPGNAYLLAALAVVLWAAIGLARSGHPWRRTEPSRPVVRVKGEEG